MRYVTLRVLTIFEAKALDVPFWAHLAIVFERRATLGFIAARESLSVVFVLFEFEAF